MGNTAEIARARLKSLPFDEWRVRVRTLVEAAGYEVTDADNHLLRLFHLTGVRAMTMAEELVAMKQAAEKLG